MDPAGRSRLHYAALNDDAAEVGRLIGEGESPDVQDDQGFTPLHLAAQQSAVLSGAALLGGGATVDATNVFGNTPLFGAVFNSRGHGEMIQLLRSHGADPLHVNNSGQTPVGLARLIGNYDVARFFEDIAG